MKKLVFLVLSVLLFMGVRGQILTDSNLPIVVIETDGGVAIPDEPKVLGTMKIIWHSDGSRNYLTDIDNPAFLNYDGRIGIEIRGSSSQMLMKKPYGLTTLKADNVTNNNVSILGMPEENDWVLNSLAFDRTGMRDVLSYELSERLGQYAPRRVYCEVMVNGDYKGLYAFMEKIKVDKGRVNIEKMDETCNAYPEVTGGYITKADKSTGGDPVAWTMPGYGGGWWGSSADFIHHYPKPENVTTAQDQYIKNVFQRLQNVASQHSTAIGNGIPSVIDIPSFVDFYMIAEFSSNVDVYSLSTFFHKDRKGKLRAGPVWDYNLAYGHDEFGNRSLYYVWQFDNVDNNGPRFFKDLFDTPTFRCYLARRWNELTQPGQPLNYEMVCQRMDEIDAWIGEGVVRDNQRWHQMNNHASELQSMKTWINQRINWLTQNIGSYEGCADVDLPPLVISKIHYHPEDWWAIEGDRLEFIEITNNGDETVDLTGVYFRELGVTYNFPEGSTVAPHEPLLLCSDSLVFMDYYQIVPFGQFNRNLSNKSENLVLADAWGNIIDQVHYYDSDPWPWEADGEGAFLQLIDLDADNSLPENWTVGYDFVSVSEMAEATEIRIYPNPAIGMITIVGGQGNYRITNVMGQTLMTGMIHGESQQVDVSRLPSGLYFITIDDRTKKVVVR
ncbi:MAG: CotH kinase family protein [Bacteroidales bacterium]|nr:CotH kinase family protein [Bacteroidales bacterium]